MRKANAQVGRGRTPRELGLRRTTAALVRQAVILPKAAKNAQPFAQLMTGIDTDFPATQLCAALLTDTIACLQRPCISQQIGLARQMLCFDHPSIRGRTVTLAQCQLCTDFRAVADACAQIDGADICAGLITLVGNGSGTDANSTVLACPVCAQTCIPFTLGELIDLVFDDDELRIEIKIAARHRLTECDGARQNIDIIIDEPGQCAAADHQL